MAESNENSSRPIEDEIERKLKLQNPENQENTEVDGKFISCFKVESSDEEEENLVSRRKVSEEFFQRNIPKQAIAPVHMHSAEYNMNHKHRGLAIILNHETFTIADEKGAQIYPPRIGTQHDVAKLRHTLSQLDFDVVVHNDLKLDEIKKLLENISQRDHSENDCLLLACLTHGEAEDFICANDQLYKEKLLREHFTNRRCLTLAGKPKIFIIQACRGKSFDAGVLMMTKDTSPKDLVRENEATPDLGDPFTLPSESDMITFYSCSPGYVSFLRSSGSPFIQTLCDVFDNNANHMDLQKMFQMVIRMVAVTYKSNVEGKEDEDLKKMLPNSSTSLMRDVVFTPKPKLDMNQENKENGEE